MFDLGQLRGSYSGGSSSTTSKRVHLPFEEFLPFVAKKEDSKSEDLCGLGIASSMKMSSTSMVMMLTMIEGALLVEAVRFSGVFTFFASLGGKVFSSLFFYGKMGCLRLV